MSPFARTVILLLLSASTARADHFEVFLVAGQSNCDGRGMVADLTGPLAKWAKPQADVLIAHQPPGAPVRKGAAELG